MYCAKCHHICLGAICSECKATLLQLSKISRRLDCGLDVFSFYAYSDIKEFLLRKHRLSGYFIYRALARLSLGVFAKEYSGQKVYSIALDDRLRGGYSHTAVLNSALRSKHITPVYGAIHARNNVKYAGKSLEYRQKHKRGYYLCKIPKSPVVLVDDIITTGLSLSEAYKLCTKHGISVAYALTLADARS